MSNSAKRWTKYLLALVVLFSGSYAFLLLGTGYWSIGLGMLAVWLFDLLFWPEVVWTQDGKITGRQRLHRSLLALVVPVLLLMFGAIFQLGA